MNSKLDKFFMGYKFPAVLLIVLGAIFSFLIFIPKKQLESANLTYDDCEYKEYTVSNITKTAGKNPYFIIEVEEEEKPVNTSNLVYGIVKKNIDACKMGDTVYMYVVKSNADDYSYKAVEIKTADTVIMSLEEYLERIRSNANAGLIFVPVIAALCIITGIAMIFKKDNTKEEFFERIGCGKLSDETKDMIFNAMNDPTPRPSHKKLLQIAKSCCFKREDKYYTSIMENENAAYLYSSLAKIVYSEMQNDELRIIYDTSCDEAVFVFYRVENCLIGEYAGMQKNSPKYVIDLDLCNVEYPKFREMTDEEKKMFTDKIENYNIFTEDIFLIEGE